MVIPFGRFGVIGYSDFQVSNDIVAGIELEDGVKHSSHSIGAEYMMYLPPAKLAITIQGLYGIAAVDKAPVNQLFVGITKTLWNAE